MKNYRNLVIIFLCIFFSACEAEWVMDLEVNEDELIKRILLRGEMTGRSDDTEDSIKVRFEVYKKDTQPLVDFYNEKNLVNVIDAVGEVDDIYNSISRHFK